MGKNKDIEALLDQVEGTPGWRVEKTDGTRWKVTPPQPHSIIHVSSSGDPHVIHNVKAQLRRAGFFHRMDPQMNRPAAPPVIPPAPIVAKAVMPTPIEAIRDDVEVIMNALGRISENLSNIETEQEGVTQLKALLRTVIK